MQSEEHGGTSREPSASISLGVILGIVVLLTIAGVGGVIALTLRHNVGEMMSKANVEVTKTQIIAVEDAIKQYQLMNRRLPASLDALVGPDGILDSNVVPTDAWGHAFLYEVIEEEDKRPKFHLKSLGRDGRDGGEGPDADIDRDAAHRRD